MVKSNLKTILTLTVIALLGIGTFSCQKEEEKEKKDNKPVNYGDYVDLGLPSGTLWKATNEVKKDSAYDFYTYTEAKAAFGDKLPTKEQCEELIDNSKCTWIDSGYTVTGPNGNTIFLPSTGSRNCDGKVIVMKVQGFYWTSTMSYSSDLAYTLNFSGTLGSLYTLDHKICYGAAVRLVRKK